MAVVMAVAAAAVAAGGESTAKVVHGIVVSLDPNSSSLGSAAEARSATGDLQVAFMDGNAPLVVHPILPGLLSIAYFSTLVSNSFKQAVNLKWIWKSKLTSSDFELRNRHPHAMLARCCGSQSTCFTFTTQKTPCRNWSSTFEAFWIEAWTPCCVITANSASLQIWRTSICKKSAPIL